MAPEAGDDHAAWGCRDGGASATLADVPALCTNRHASLVLPSATIEALIYLLQQQLNDYTAEFGSPAVR
jgi:hypothetical protein